MELIKSMIEVLLMSTSANLAFPSYSTANRTFLDGLTSIDLIDRVGDGVTVCSSTTEFDGVSVKDVDCRNSRFGVSLIVLLANILRLLLTLSLLCNEEDL